MKRIEASVQDTCGLQVCAKDLQHCLRHTQLDRVLKNGTCLGSTAFEMASSDICIELSDI